LGSIDFNSNVNLTGKVIQNGFLRGTGDVTVTGTYEWNSGEISGTGTTIVGAGGTLRVTGVGGSVSNQRPFTNLGILLIEKGQLTTANYMQGAGAVLSVQIGGLVAGNDFGILAVSEAVLSGRLNVSLASGYSPNLGDQFQIFNFLNRSGTFGQITGLDVGSGKHLDPSFSATSLTLTTVTSP